MLDRWATWRKRLRRPSVVALMVLGFIWVASAFGTFFVNLHHGPNQLQIAIQTGEFFVTWKIPDLSELFPISADGAFLEVPVAQRSLTFEKLIFEEPVFRRRADGNFQFWLPFWMVAIFIVLFSKTAGWLGRYFRGRPATKSEKPTRSKS